MTEMLKNYYFAYLGFDEEAFKKGQRVFKSEQRGLPLNKYYFHPMICTVFEKEMIFSVSPLYYDVVKSVLGSKKLHTFNEARELGASVFTISTEKGTLSQMTRLYWPLDIPIIMAENQANRLTEAILEELIQHKSELEKEQIRLTNQEDIHEGSKFIIFENNQIIAQAKVSNVDYQGANIAVYTDQSYRGLGYGKQVVLKCVQWCLERNVIPIYWVRNDNFPSVNLAKSLGFVNFADELVYASNSQLG